MTETVQTVIFDLGDVVCDTDIMSSCRRLAQFSELSAEDIFDVLYHRSAIYDFSSGRISEDQWVTWCLSEGRFDLDPDTFHDIYCDIFCLNNDVVRLIERLGDRSQLLLLSNTNPWHFPYCNIKYHLHSRFDHLIVSYEVGAMKPESAIYQHTLRHVRHRDRVVFIDDIQGHVEAAEQFGIRGVRFVDIDQLRADLTRLGFM